MKKELELYVIELFPKCWSICSTLSETKQRDTPRTMRFGSAEVYRYQEIADRHCDNIIKGGKFTNAKVIPLQIKQALSNQVDVEEVKSKINAIQEVVEALFPKYDIDNYTNNQGYVMRLYDLLVKYPLLTPQPTLEELRDDIIKVLSNKFNQKVEYSDGKINTTLVLDHFYYHKGDTVGCLLGYNYKDNVIHTYNNRYSPSEWTLFSKYFKRLESE